MKRAFLIATVILSGCASSPQELKSKPPYAQFNSEKPVSTLISCISGKMEERSYGLNPLQTFVKPIQGGDSISTVGNAEIIEVRQQGNISDINYYSIFPGRIGLNQGRIDGIKNDIESCL